MTFKLDPLPLARMVDEGGRPTQAYQRLFNKALDKIASQINDILTAQAAAEAADAKAVAAARESARINSYTNPGQVLSAADAGSDATITVANHTRIYPVQGSLDVPDVAIIGTTLTGQPYSSRVYVYYDDTTQADTTPTFVATTVAATAQVGASAGRHALGYIDTPASGGTPTSGGGASVPGGGGGNTSDSGKLP